MVMDRRRRPASAQLIGVPDREFQPYAVAQGCDLDHGITTRHCWAAAAAMLVNWHEQRRPGLGADDLVELFEASDGMGRAAYLETLARIAPRRQGVECFYAPQERPWPVASAGLITLLGRREPVLTLVGPRSQPGPSHVVVATKAVVVGSRVHHLTVFDPWQGRIPVSQDLEQIHGYVAHWGDQETRTSRHATEVRNEGFTAYRSRDDIRG